MRKHSPTVKAALVAFALACAALPLPSLETAAQQQGATRDIRAEITIKDEKGAPIKLYEKSYALVVGASEYTAGWSKLKGAERDVEAVSVALERQGFQVTVVKNPDAALLRKSFEEFIRQHGQQVENRLLFYFAGHGHTMKQSYGADMGYIVPVDAPRPDADPAGFRDKALNMKQVERYAEDVQSKHALFLFDSCFSGSVLGLSPKRAIPEPIGYKTSQHVRQFIASGDAGETVPDESIFRKQFVEAIEGAADTNKDKYVTGTELGEFLQDKVITYSKSTQHPQYGKIRNEYLDKGDFVFSLARPTPRVPANPKPGMVVTGAAGIELVYVPPGSFMMGSENGEADEKPVHRVTFREGFWMGKYEVTQAQWQATMGYNPSNFEGDNLPVESVSWNDAQKFIKKLNAADDGFEYRLPSEAEWEYACRADTKTEFAVGDLLSSGQANFDGRSPYGGGAKGVYRERTTPVGSFQPNPFGLYDMHGNIHEWCADVWHANYHGAPADGSAWVNGGDSNFRVLRGGAWNRDAGDLRSSNRSDSSPSFVTLTTASAWSRFRGSSPPHPSHSEEKGGGHHQPPLILRFKRPQSFPVVREGAARIRGRFP